MPETVEETATTSESGDSGVASTSGSATVSTANTPAEAAPAPQSQTVSTPAATSEKQETGERYSLEAIKALKDELASSSPQPQATPDTQSLAEQIQAINETIAQLKKEEKQDLLSPSTNGTKPDNGVVKKFGAEHVLNHPELYPDKKLNEAAKKDLTDFKERLDAGRTTIQEELAFAEWFKEVFLPAQYLADSKNTEGLIRTRA